jgi:hypothetical protein
MQHVMAESISKKCGVLYGFFAQPLCETAAAGRSQSRRER